MDKITAYVYITQILVKYKKKKKNSFQLPFQRSFCGFSKLKVNNTPNSFSFKKCDGRVLGKFLWPRGLSRPNKIVNKF